MTNGQDDRPPPLAQPPPGRQPVPSEPPGAPPEGAPFGPPPVYRGPRPPGPSGPRANFGQRLGAALLDGLILGGGVLVVGLAFAALGPALQGPGEQPDPLFVILVVLLWLALAVFSIGYFIYFEGGPTGQTWGKRALNIRVIDARTGQAIGYGKATVRYLARILSQLPCYLGYLWMLWDDERQTWHDKLSDSVVVPTAAYPVQR